MRGVVSRRRSWLPRLGIVTVLRFAAAAFALVQVGKGAKRVAPLAAPADSTADSTGARTELPTISVVIPARDEALRLPPLLAALRAAPGIVEVIVVDDESSDGTADIARNAGAAVVAGRPLPGEWVGKAWALQQGIEAATGDWVVCLDADTRPSPALPAAIVARALADDLGFVTLGGRFRCPTAGAAWLHPAMLTTLVYRYGPPGSTAATPPSRVLGNGQCMAFERKRLLAAGGMEPVGGEVVEDVALARHLAATGWNVAMLDGADLLTTQMFEDLQDTWNGWSRSLALPGVDTPARQWLGIGIVAVTLASPLPRLLLKRGDALDVALLAARIGTLVGTARAYERRGLAYWSSPLADAPAAVALVRGALSRRQVWRGRSYPNVRPARTAGR